MILIIDDETYIRSSLSGLLGDEGYETASAGSAEEGEQILKQGKVELVLLDIQMPGKDGLTFLEDNKSRLEGVPVIIISGRGDIATAVTALKMGAYDYIEKPLSPERVVNTIKQARRLSQSIESEKKLVDRILDDYKIIGQATVVDKLRRLISKAASVDSTVLITGQTGTGKELVARHIHYLSKRKSHPLVTVNCPSVPETLFEAEFFGHVKGSFTGAGRDRKGRVEAASGGSLFLDEIGDLPISSQPKLLRLLESGEFNRVGSDEITHIDFRLIAATNRNLREMVDKGEFREDLYYRLNVINIEVVPLKDRIEDLPLLLDFFIDLLGEHDAGRFSSDALGLMASWEWPGNIRQLKNFVEQVLFLAEPCEGEIGAGAIQKIYNSDEIVDDLPATKNENRLKAAIRRFETGYLSNLYSKHNGNVAAMARELNMDRGNLSRKLKQSKIV